MVGPRSVVSVVRTREVEPVDALRVPPHSVEAEQAVLGGILLDNHAWEQVADRLGAEDFYRRDHRLIFDGMRMLVDAGKPCDAVTLAEHLLAQGALDEAGGLEYLGTLARDTPSAANVRAYADIVRERAVLRGLIKAGGEIASSAYAPGGRSSVQLLDEAEKRVFEISERGARASGGFHDMQKVLTATVTRLDELFHNQSHVTGVATGIDKFDEMTAGLQKGDLVIVAGRPSSGKTSFAMNVAEHAAISGKLPVAIFSMEMSATQLVMRMLSSLGRVDQKKVRTGKLDDPDWDRLTSTMSLMQNAPIYIDDTAALNPVEVRARSRRLTRECERRHGKPLGLIVVDYLQLMQSPGAAKENRATEVADISRSLKQLAKELSVPVVALSQLNRKVDDRPGKKPVMSDLRESGAIEQDADLIVFIARPEKQGGEEGQTGGYEDAGPADIIIGKQRNGPTGDFKVTFLGRYTRFENYAPDSWGDER
jgi:replicative DNA helicase